jgi:hypothetical protein
MAEARQEPTVARVDRLVDENAMPIEVPEDSELKIAHAVEQWAGRARPPGGGSASSG